ncbi:MAG: ABC transporter substrate-binding protein [Chloroflexi bacterium]|nr:ABC transporter substrate-binding protein [Chloroflexota bacterium]
MVSAGVAPVWLALDHGLWQKHGLEVELTLISGAPNNVAALLAGDVQFIQNSGDAMLPFQAREPNITAFLNTSASSAHRMIVQPDIQRPEELRGKRLGVFTLGDGNYALISKALPLFGINPEREVLWTPVGGGNMGGFVGALAAGAIDAALLTPPTDLAALNNGAKVLFNYADLGLPYGGLPVYTLRNTLESQRTVAEAYAAGIIDGVRLFKSDAQLGKAALQKWAQLTDPAALDWTYEAYRGDRVADRPYVDVAQLEQVKEAMATEQPELRDLQVERVVDRTVLDALDRRGLLPPP